MTLAEKLIAARAASIATKDAITAITSKDTQDEAEMHQLDELSGVAERQANDLSVLERAEKALALGAKPALPGDVGAPATQERSAPALALGGHLRAPTKGFDLMVRSALITYESYCNHEPIDAVIARRYPNNLQVAETSKFMAGIQSKSAIDPAMTNIAGWAAELVRDSYAAFMDALRPESIVPRIPQQTYEFDNYGRILLPMRNDTYPTDPNLAGAFRAEGMPVRVGRTTLTSKYLTPKSMGVIGSFTKELLRRSTPNIEEAIRQWMLEDTAMMLDVVYLDNQPATAIRPAGIRNGILPQDTRVSQGNTAQDITNDIMAMLTGLSNRHMGRRPVWIMNQARAWGIVFSRTPTGDPAFPGMEGGNGTLAGIPVVASVTVPLDVVLLVDAAELAFAGGAPTFEGTDVATIHEDDGAPNANGVTGATVLPLATGAPGAAVVATPQRSLYQTHSAALKAMWEIDWTVARTGAVQELTGVAWGTP